MFDPKIGRSWKINRRSTRWATSGSDNLPCRLGIGLKPSWGVYFKTFMENGKMGKWENGWNGGLKFWESLFLQWWVQPLAGIWIKKWSRLGAQIAHKWLETILTSESPMIVGCEGHGDPWHRWIKRSNKEPLGFGDSGAGQRWTKVPSDSWSSGIPATQP